MITRPDGVSCSKMPGVGGQSIGEIWRTGYMTLSTGVSAQEKAKCGPLYYGSLQQARPLA